MVSINLAMRTVKASGSGFHLFDLWRSRSPMADVAAAPGRSDSPVCDPDSAGQHRLPSPASPVRFDVNRISVFIRHGCVCRCPS